MKLSQQTFPLAILSLLLVAIVCRGILFGFEYSIIFGSVDGTPILDTVRPFYESLLDNYGTLTAILFVFLLVRLPLLYIDKKHVILLLKKKKLEPLINQINQEYPPGANRQLAIMNLFEKQKYRPFLMLPFIILKLGVPICVYILLIADYPMVRELNATTVILVTTAVLVLFLSNRNRVKEATNRIQKFMPIISFLVITPLAIYILPPHLLFFIILMQLTEIVSEKLFSRLEIKNMEKSIHV